MEKYQPILRRLKAAAQERGVRDKMTAEDDFLEEMEYLERNHEERMRNHEERTRRLDEKERSVDEKERSVDEKMRIVGEEIRKAEAEKRKAEDAIRLLLDLGMSKAEIAVKLGLSEAEMQRY